MTNISKEQSKKIKDLVRKTCCNYIKENCLLLDDGDSHKCVQIIADSSVMCKYFEKVVLPTEKNSTMIFIQKRMEVIKNE